MIGAAPGIGFAQATVRVQPASLQGPRPLPEQTGTAAIRDSLQSWKSLRVALEQNRADLLDPSFVGTAKDKITETIRQQAALGIRTLYQDRSHDIQIVFYSPEGLSIELTDKVEYDVQVLDHDQVKTTQQLSARYVIVLTPAEVRWRVRVFQAAP
jgi:predicted PhzF superfamily epimerase YddE/YHI9